MTTELQRTLAEMTRVTGKRYRIDLSPLSEPSLRELVRFIRDVEQDKLRAVQQARLNPWKR